MTRLMRACLDCGRPSPAARCPEHTRAKYRERQRTRDPRPVAIYASSEWRRLADAVVASASRCAWCGTSAGVSKLTAGHIVSIAEDPSRALDPANVAASCRPCQERAKREPDPRRWPEWARTPRRGEGG